MPWLFTSQSNFYPPLPTKQKSWNSRCCVTPDHPLLKYVLDFCAWSENKVFTPFFSKTFPSSRCQQILWTALIFKEGRNSPLVCWPFDRIFGSAFLIKNGQHVFLASSFDYVYPRRSGCQFGQIFFHHLHPDVDSGKCYFHSCDHERENIPQTNKSILLLLNKLLKLAYLALSAQNKEKKKQQKCWQVWPFCQSFHVQSIIGNPPGPQFQGIFPQHNVRKNI